MREKKPASKPAVKKADTARRLAPKAAPRPKAVAGDPISADEDARGLALLAAAKAATSYDGPKGLAAVLECVGTISEETADVLEETVRWLRGQDEPDEPCTSSTPTP